MISVNDSLFLVCECSCVCPGVVMSLGTQTNTCTRKCMAAHTHTHTHTHTHNHTHGSLHTSLLSVQSSQPYSSNQEHSSHFSQQMRRRRTAEDGSETSVHSSGLCTLVFSSVCVCVLSNIVIYRSQE